MIKRMEVFLIAAVFILITIIILIVYSKQRQNEFENHTHIIQESVVKGASYAINLRLTDKKRHVRLFAEEYVQLFSQLSSNPTDETSRGNIKYRLQQRFPDFFAFTITNQNAEPVLQDIESLVGDICQHDLKQFSDAMGRRSNRNIVNKVFIHPQANHYHYDIMTPLYLESTDKRIFFSSFHLQEIADILKTHEVPGQSLILVRQSEPDLVEVTREGARDKIKRSIHLTKEEQKRITVREKIKGSDWLLVNLPDASYVKDYVKGLWVEAIITVLASALAVFLLIFALGKMPKPQ